MARGDETVRNDMIRDELDLAQFIVNKYRFALGTYYYGINLISRNLKVSPDIDLLSVYVNERRPDENTAVGFELKVLRYHKGRKRIELSPFYQGLGQVLTYFQHGIDRAMLIVGFHKDCEEHPEATRDVVDLMKIQCNLLKENISTYFPYLQIISLMVGSTETLLFIPEWDKKRLQPKTEDTKLRRTCIFNKQFSYKKLLS